MDKMSDIKLVKQLTKTRDQFNAEISKRVLGQQEIIDQAKEITKRAKEENIQADVFGPLAFDNSVSKKSAAIKKIKNEYSKIFKYVFNIIS